MTKVPRATWRLPVTGASSAYRVGPRRAPFVDGSHLELIGLCNRGLEQRRGGVQRSEARDAPLDGGATDLESILEHRVPVSRVLVDVGHRVDDELNLAAHDDVEDGGALLSDLRHHARRESGSA